MYSLTQRYVVAHIVTARTSCLATTTWICLKGLRQGPPQVDAQLLGSAQHPIHTGSAHPAPPPACQKGPFVQAHPLPPCALLHLCLRCCPSVGACLQGPQGSLLALVCWTLHTGNQCWTPAHLGLGVSMRFSEVWTLAADLLPQVPRPTSTELHDTPWNDPMPCPFSPCCA